jgi:hypothetical protein
MEGGTKMSTTIRPELSEKNKYWINKHRYYELKHFCLQYPEWKKAYLALDGYSKQSSEIVAILQSTGCSDPTAKCAMARMHYADRMKMVEQAAIGADPELASYILKGVTEGISYEYLKARLDIPCCKDTYYDRFRRFFWLLSNARD